MKRFKFTLIMLFSASIYAEPVQIDMHGGKHMKMPSKDKQIGSMKDMLKMDTNTTDKNTSSEKNE